MLALRALLPALLLLAGCAAVPAPAPARPNVVLIYTDDQGYGDCGALNPEARFATPNLDRLAREGLLLTDAHSAGSVCTPSRYALLTGRYAWRASPGGGVLGADADCLIEDGRTTIASLLSEEGYATALFGKWHLGMQVPGTKGDRDWSQPVLDGPLQKGFDTFYGIPASMNFGVLTWFDGDRATAPADLWTRKKFPPAEIVTAPLHYRMAPPYDAEQQEPRDIEVAADFVDTDALRIITERTVAFVEARAGAPFFAYVALTSPHLPHCAAPGFQGTSGMGSYGDFMAETDHRVGQVLDALDRAGVADDTIVIVTSDNGAENNRHDWLRLYDHDSSGGLRGGKRDVYEGGHRVPFLVRWPRVIESGRVSGELVSQLDVLPTLAELLDVELGPDAAEDGVSFLPILRDERTARGPRPLLLHHGRGRFAVRESRWKLILERGEDGPASLGAPTELYDLREDPGETTDRLDAHAELAAELLARASAAL